MRLKHPRYAICLKPLKYYESKHYIVSSENRNIVPKKRFEYIVQGMRAGKWQIPPQEFVIFDVEKEAYKTFKTKPLTVTITSNTAMQNTASSQNAAGEKPSDQVSDMLADELVSP